MKHRIVNLLAVTVTAAMVLGTLAGCSKKEAPVEEVPAAEETVEEAAEEEAEAEEPAEEAAEEVAEEDVITDEDAATGIAAEYTSPQGWMVSYDADNITCNEYDDHTDFVYTGECGGTEMFTYTYIEGKLPAEVIEELKEKTGAADDQIIESTFLTGEPCINILPAADAAEGSGMMDQYYAVEHNGDTLLIEAISHVEPDELAYEISGRMEALFDSFIWLQAVE